MKRQMCELNKEGNSFAEERGTRLHHLDALRGLAALTVAVSHSFNSFNNIPYGYYINILGGRIPVMYFFLLSGFVLSRSLYKVDGLSYRNIAAYTARRLFRLYPTTIASLLLGLIASLLYSPPQSWTPVSGWLASQFNPHSHISIRDLLGIVTLSNLSFNAPVWTIRVELICSLLLPWLILFVTKIPRLSIPIVLILSLILESHQAGGALGEFGWLFAFYLGYLAYTLVPLVGTLSPRSTKLLLFLAILALISTIHLGLDTVSGVIILSFILLVLIPCNWAELRHILEIAPLQFLGRISFSFYLVHTPILLLTWSFIQRKLPYILHLHEQWVSALMISAASICGTILLASISERFIERPCNKYGHILANFILSKASKTQTVFPATECT